VSGPGRPSAVQASEQGLAGRFWVTAKGLRLLGVDVPADVADSEAVLPVDEVVR
jgi:hypothetical protein